MSDNAVTAAVLCGGLGTRLRSVIGESLPKCLAPVAGRPFLLYVLDQLISHGVQKVVLCTGHGHTSFYDALGWSKVCWEVVFTYRGGLDIHASREREPLGTGGALKNALPLFNSDPVLVLNGDTYLRFNLGKILPAW